MLQYNYDETPIEGVSRKRAKQIIIDNFLDQPPYITYQEETVAVINSEQHQETAGTVGGPVDPEGVISLRDLDTGELTGETVPVGLIYAALYSDYLNRAFERDNSSQPAE
jgi:hypothetical protein